VLGAGAFAGKNAQTMTRLGILYWHFNPLNRGLDWMRSFAFPWQKYSEMTKSEKSKFKYGIG
jgi:hypothetical protein